MLLAICGAVVAHLLWLEAPKCNCFGPISAYLARRADARAAWWVSAGLAAGLVPLALADDAPATSRGRETKAPREIPPGGRRGVTLIETLLVIALLGSLLLIALPLVSDTRRHARDLRTASLLRQHALNFSAYQLDWKDHFPCPAVPGASLTVVRLPPDRVYTMRYFESCGWWSLAMTCCYEDPRPESPTIGGASRDRALYSAAFLADPRFWNQRTRTGPEQWRATKSHEVAFPSGKSLLVGLYQAQSFERRIPWAAVDGSAHVTPIENFTKPYPTGEGPWQGALYRFGVVGSHTIDGVLGRDVR